MGSKIGRDTVILTFISLFLQGFGLLFNIYITKILGTENVGIITLIATFYGLAAIIAGGNIFICTNRQVSEEIAINGSPPKIFTYAVIFCLLLSIGITGIIFIFADNIAINLIKNPDVTVAIRILALSLPIGTLSNCLKGFFHAHREIIFSSIADCVDSILRIVAIVCLIQFGVLPGKISLFLAFALAVIFSTIINCVLMVVHFCKHKQNKAENLTEKPSKNFGKFLLAALPITFNSYIISILSSANDALIPVTLKQFGSSTSDALSKFGIFEAIVIPVLFFPAIITSCLSCILLPEISKAAASGNTIKVKHLTKRALSATLYYSVIIVILFLCFGRQLGTLLSGEDIAGTCITLMAPVVPLIYLEIVFEGILRGLGKYSFSTLNYVAEYVVRISVLLICVPLIGFYGLVISYILSNLVGNIARIKIIGSIIDIKFKEVIFNV